MKGQCAGVKPYLASQGSSRSVCGPTGPESSFATQHKSFLDVRV